MIQHSLVIPIESSRLERLRNNTFRLASSFRPNLQLVPAVGRERGQAARNTPRRQTLRLFEVGQRGNSGRGPEMVVHRPLRLTGLATRAGMGPAVLVQ